jgi:arylsulfatase A-like enzyme
MKNLLLVFVASTLAVAEASTTTDQASPQTAASLRQPNIVFIFADDLGIGDTSVYGSRVIETPNIDALARNGIRFTNGYVSHPVCSPSRAGLMTGRYQQRHGWELNPAGRDASSGMSINERTLADVMKAEGYATGMIGKWHLGYQGPHHPLQRGFDEFFGVLAGGSLYIDPATPGVQSAGPPISATRSSRIGVFRGQNEVEVTDYLTDVFTDEAVAFIDRHQHKPFFLYLSHTTPHTPLQATAEYLDRYRHVEDIPTRIYAAMVASLDDSVGAVIKKLEEIGALSNTLIVFSSDNGCAGYIRGACSNAPYAGFKRYHQEGGIRVPLIMSWQKELPAGTLYQHPVIALDLLATFSATAGGSAITEDSVNLLPYLRRESAGAPHEFLYWRSGPTQAVRDDRWKLIRYNRTPLTAEDLRADGRLEPPADGWPTDSLHGRLTLLYDLREDPGETENLADRHPEIVDRLQRAYDQWNEQLLETPILPGIRSTLVEMHGETVQLIF